MKKNKIIILILFVVFSSTIKAQTNTIDTSKLSTTNFTISKSNTSNHKLRIYNSMLDIDNFNIVDYNLQNFSIPSQQFACPPYTNTSPKSIVEIDFSSLTIGVYFIKSTLNNSDIFYKVSITN